MSRYSYGLQPYGKQVGTLPFTRLCYKLISLFSSYNVCICFFLNYQKHEKLHTGEKNFKCEHCNKSFAESTGLKIHLETHNLARDKSCDQV